MVAWEIVDKEILSSIMIVESIIYDME